MSLAVLKSRALTGMEATEVAVEIHISSGLPSFTLVGLPDTEVREARDRVRAAIQNCRFEFPSRRITVNLAPADLPKESGHFDLAIALGILAASGQLACQQLGDYEFAGELSLSGELRPIRGALAMSLAAHKAGRCLMIAAANAPEAALIGGATVLPAASLLDVCAHLGDATPLAPAAALQTENRTDYPDLADVKGQTQAKRALEVAAAGGHSLLMSGPPGTGKSMLAARFPALLPPMRADEAFEAAAVRSIAGDFAAEHWGRRPFRAPHHSASAAALVGGGSTPRPGEISLAHCGVLFLDELPEFDRRVLEALREPLESGTICVSRAARRADFPARFQLIAAMNPCPCGYLGHPNGKCRCTPDQVARYRGKLSGPLLDRIDLAIEVPALTDAELQHAPVSERSEHVRARVVNAHARQQTRQGKTNALLSVAETEAHCRLDTQGEVLLKQAIGRLGLSPRGYHRILRIARSVADLADSEDISSLHLAEAINYRRHQAA
ncbi:MAG: YifB family Mg chelatase-like AAA ATPase [Rhodocyclaceae bacterium]|nr:YifB family Mg chelatase-like AAA ATPase [Rhodocyclaceae bacterium]